MTAPARPSVRTISPRLPILLVAAAIAGCAHTGSWISGASLAGSDDEPTADVLSPPPPRPERVARVQESTAVDGRTRTTLRDFEAVEDPQRELVWCWAACASMVLRYDGGSETQEDVAARVHGYDANGAAKVAAASRYEAMRALSPDAPATTFDAVWSGIEREVVEASAGALDGVLEGRPVEANLGLGWDEDAAVGEAFSRLYPSTGVPVAQLRNGDPAIVGLRDPGESMGHIYVLVGATWSERDTRFWQGAKQWTTVVVGELPSVTERLEPSGLTIHSVELVDPWLHDDPDTEENEARVELPFEDFASRVDFVTTRQDAHATLNRWTGLAELEVE